MKRLRLWLCRKLLPIKTIKPGAEKKLVRAKVLKNKKLCSVRLEWTTHNVYQIQIYYSDINEFREFDYRQDEFECALCDFLIIKSMLKIDKFEGEES